jgi:hypothetical protein
MGWSVKEGWLRRHKTTVIVALIGVIFGAVALYTYNTFFQDTTAPEVKDLKYHDRVGKGEDQELSTRVYEENPVQYLTLNLNGTSLQS